jgi:putative phosphoesterase
MRIAFLSDVHANLPALDAALALIHQQQVERVVIAGDLVGEGPFPAETIRGVRERPDVAVIRGNVDRKVARLLGKKRGKLKKRLAEGGGTRANLAWTALALRGDEGEWLTRLEPQLVLAAAGKKVLIVHGSPRGDEDYVYPSLTPEALATKLEPVEGPAPDLLVCGHSHVPFVRTVAATLVVNCGSVGRPADGDPRGSLVVAELADRREPRAEVFRFEYPVDEVCRAVEERGTPGIDPDEYRLGIKG